MESTEKTTITVKATINKKVEEVWECWTAPKHIVNWNFAAETWHSPSAINDLKTGGKFSYRMEAKDGSFGFDYWGIYDLIRENKLIVFTLGDGRKVSVTFSGNENETEIIETFEAENTNPVEMQQTGWQSILNNFKKYAEQI